MALIDFWNKWALFHTRNRHLSVEPTEAVFEFSTEMRCHWWQIQWKIIDLVRCAFFFLFRFYSVQKSIRLCNRWMSPKACRRRWWMKNRIMISWLNDESGSNTMRLVNRLMHSYIDLYSINFQMIYTVNCFALDNHRCSNVCSLCFFCALFCCCCCCCFNSFWKCIVSCARLIGNRSMSLKISNLFDRTGQWWTFYLFATKAIILIECIRWEYYKNKI